MVSPETLFSAFSGAGVSQGEGVGSVGGRDSLDSRQPLLRLREDRERKQEDLQRKRGGGRKTEEEKESEREHLDTEGDGKVEGGRERHGNRERDVSISRGDFRLSDSGLFYRAARSDRPFRRRALLSGTTSSTQPSSRATLSRPPGLVQPPLEARRRYRVGGGGAGLQKLI